MYKVEHYHCSYCHETDDSKLDMAEHESECSFNPKNRMCWTCQHRTPDHYSYGCALGVIEDISVYDEVARDCEKWVARG